MCWLSAAVCAALLLFLALFPRIILYCISTTAVPNAKRRCSSASCSVSPPLRRTVQRSRGSPRTGFRSHLPSTKAGTLTMRVQCPLFRALSQDKGPSESQSDGPRTPRRRELKRSFQFFGRNERKVGAQADWNRSVVGAVDPAGWAALAGWRGRTFHGGTSCQSTCLVMQPETSRLSTLLPHEMTQFVHSFSWPSTFLRPKQA